MRTETQRRPPRLSLLRLGVALLALGTASCLDPALDVRGTLDQAVAGAEALGPTSSGPSLELTTVEQAAAVFSGYVVKPTYMLVSLLLFFFLRRGRSRDLGLLRIGLAAFFLGEAACALNYLLTGGRSEVLEALHGLGMAGMGGATAWGLFVLADERLLGLTRPTAGCSLRRFCGRCWKQDRTGCFAHRLFVLLAPALTILATMPLFAPLRELDLVGGVFGTPVAYLYSRLQLLTDFRVYPMLAVLGFAVTAILLPFGEQAMRRTQPIFFTAFGFFSFSLFRFLLLAAYRQRPVWLDFWEEITELLLIGFLAAFFALYRERFGLARPAVAGGEP